MHSSLQIGSVNGNLAKGLSSLAKQKDLGGVVIVVFLLKCLSASADAASSWSFLGIVLADSLVEGLLILYQSVPHSRDSLRLRRRFAPVPRKIALFKA